MKKIFINFNSLGGCALHRLILPYFEVKKQTDEFQFTFGFKQGTKTFESMVELIASHDILIFHRILPDGLLDAVRQANPNIKVIIDMDDNWVLNEQHILFNHYNEYNITEKIQYHLLNADYVICTTEYLANKIRPFNKNVVIFPNALNPEEQFTPEPTLSDKIRFGIIGSITHNKDLTLLKDIFEYIPDDIRNKMQIVLCGFDNHIEWFNMEKMLTSNYRFIDSYRRVEAKDIYNYATSYNDIDVLLVPLLSNKFTACKSELKLIEASVMHKAAIVSDTMPYTICGINALNKGGELNPNGNCLMVPESKGPRGWAKAIIRLVKNKELRDIITINLAKLTSPGAPYCLTEVSKRRIEWLKSIK